MPDAPFWQDLAAQLAALQAWIDGQHALERFHYLARHVGSRLDQKYHTPGIKAIDFIGVCMNAIRIELGYSHDALNTMSPKALYGLAADLCLIMAQREEPTKTALVLSESIAEKIKRLREESGWTVEELAAQIRKDPTTVFRHLSGRMIPGSRTISAYERVFSKRLKRQILIRNTP